MPVYTGETYDTREQRQDQLPDLGRDEANGHPFTFIHSPGSWECVDLQAFGVPEADRQVRWEWVPRLKHFWHRPGVNGVAARAGGLGRALGEYQERGWIVISPDHGPDGLSYVQRIRTRRGDRFCDVWTSYVKVGIGRVAPRFDDLGYLQWRRQLVRDGVVPLPPPEVIEGQIATVANQISRLEGRAHLPHVQTQIEALQQQLAGMKAQAYAESADSTSTRRTRRKG